MRRIIMISVLVYLVNLGYGQSVTWTYSLGDIPTNINGVSLGCNEIPIDITLPAGPSITVTGVDVAYDFTAVGSGFISDQRSAILYPGQTNAQYVSGVGNNPGTSNYEFLGETDANGTYPGGHVLNFVFRAFRTFGAGTPTCNTTFNKIDNNTLTITVYYTIDPEDGSIGIGTDTPDNSAILDIRSSQKGFLPPRMTSVLMNGIPSPEEGLTVFCTDCEPAGMYSRVGAIWTTASGSANPGFVLDGDLVRQNAFSFNDDFIFGRNELPTASSISDTMMFFDYSKAAFRGGRLQTSNAFGSSNVGSASFAFGENAIASGDGSAAIGSFVSATDIGAFAAGSTASASAYGAVALGEGSASGYTSFASGSGVATGENSVAMGGSSVASGDYSTAVGRGTLARSWGETVVGSYNTDYSPVNTFDFDDNDRLFVVGMGQHSGDRQDALTILKDGHVGIGTSNPSLSLDVNGNSIFRANVFFAGASSLELQALNGTKETTSGRLSYPSGSGPVVLTGGGTTLASRRIELRALGGVEIDGGTDIGGNLDVGGDILIQNDNDLILEKSPGQTTVEILASEGTGGGQITLFNDDGTATIEIDADFGAGNVGRLTLDEIDIHGGSDIAEYFDSNEELNRLERGTLVCIDEENEGKMKPCDEVRDRKVLGVISGANGIKPGMIMGQDGSIANGDFPIALVGRVYVKSNHQNGPIQVGDFLTSSSTKGEAMRVENIRNAQGAILGKALTKRNLETGFVLVLVNLQ